MRRMLTVLVIGTALMPLSACGSEPDPDASPSAASPAPATSAPATPSASPAEPTGPTRPTRPRPSPPATTATAPGPPDSGELPGELPHGDRKLTGVVERSGDCAMLRVGDRLWGLTGGPVQPLRPGDRVTVQGQVTSADGACAEAGATRGMVVRRVTES